MRSMQEPLPLRHGEAIPTDRTSRFALRALPLLALLAFLASPATAQWSTQSPRPTFLDVRGVAALSPDHVFIGTDDDSFDDGGALFESLDGGMTWVQRDVPFNLFDGINGMFFLDAETGWIYGNSNYRTDDGGTTWTELPFLGSTYFMEFHTPVFGMASGNSGAMISRDSGSSWEPSPNEIYQYDFWDGQLGLGVADSTLYRTTDGGNSFSSVLVGDAESAAFLTGDVAVAILDGSFARSTDGGQTWTPGSSAEGRTRLEPISSDVILAWGRGGSWPDYDDRILRSADAGQTWSDLGEVIDEGVWAFATPGAQTVVAADLAGNMFQSVDAGATWIQAFSSPGPRPGFLSSAVPAFADAQNGYFGFGPGFVIRTTNGGSTWEQISSGAGQTLRDIDRFPGGDLIAVGENGTVLTSTGSTPWIIHEVFTPYHLEAVDVVGASEVIVIDESGRIHMSADGGETWTAGATVPSGLEGQDLDFTSLEDGWVTGSGYAESALFHTTDGGGTWVSVPEAQGGYVAVDFEGSSGWAANVSGRFYRSTDDGDTWTQGDLPGSTVLVKDMDFYDVSIGYAVGWWGYAARSDDGGLTWDVLPTPNGDDQLTDIHLLGPNELWVSATNDVAYYTANGGQNWALLEVGSQGFGSFSAIFGTPEGDAWAVGFQGYIEHFVGPPPPPLNRPPEASFDFVTTGLTVDLTDTSVDPDGVIVSWFWDFGDGTTSTEQNTSHTYDLEDTYHVRLTVTDDDGDTGSTVRFIVVQPGPGGTFGDFTEVTPLDPLFVTPQDEDFWVATTASADYDNDNDLDIVVLGYYVVYNESVEERLVLLRNDGPAGPGEWEFSYVDVPLGDLSAGASDLAWGDVDNDGDQDLLVGTDGQSVIYRNDDGTLVVTDTVLPGYYEDNDQADFDLQSITWADFDNDSDLDLLLPSVFDWETFSYRTALMRNDGSNETGGWVFTEVDSVFATARHAQSAWADYDDDQDLDLLLVHLAPLRDDGFIRRYRNDGNGIFVGEDILGELTVEHGEAQWGDYDEDGDFDILIAGHIKELDGSFSRVLRVYRNDGETFVPVEVVDCLPCEGWIDITAATWADYDSDGDVDILMTGSYNSGSQIDGRAKIYANVGGVFVDSGNDLPAPRAGGSRGGSFTWMDLDGDLDLDYFIAGEYYVPGGNGLIEAQMHVYRNDAEGQNLAPSGPTGLTAVPEGEGGVRLSWTPATDDQTPVDALTYDLVVYPEGASVAVPRRLPEPGSISAATEWALEGLADGDYTWVLRAVDSAYNGGPPAEGGFTIGSTAGVDPGDAIPAFHDLGSSPNPFRHSTSFQFALPAAAEVGLSIFDVEGRVVARLVEGVRDAGVHEVSWDASQMPSGTYFARFSADGFTRTRRVLLVK